MALGPRPTSHGHGGRDPRPVRRQPGRDPRPGRLDLPALVLEAEPLSAQETAAVERLLGGLGAGPGWSGIAPDAPPR